MGELKPCPFCGDIPGYSTAYISMTGDKDEFTGSCPNCGLRLPVSWKDPMYAKMRWNTRPIEAALRARIEELTIPEDIKSMVIDGMRYAEMVSRRTGWINSADAYQKCIDWLTAYKEAQG
jgi:hypothetical protein